MGWRTARWLGSRAIQVSWILERLKPAHRSAARRYWTKSVKLFDFFLALAEQNCAGHGLECITSRDPDWRGSHISFRHPHAFALCQALIADGVIGDFRAPDVIRFGLTPLYLGFEDLWRAIETLRDILETGRWHDARFAVRGKVT